MSFGDTEVMKLEGNIRLLKVECRGGKVSYCVGGNGPTKHYDDYDDALDEFNLRRMKGEA